MVLSLSELREKIAAKGCFSGVNRYAGILNRFELKQMAPANLAPFGFRS
jgi:hypothetical protein